MVGDTADIMEHHDMWAYVLRNMLNDLSTCVCVCNQVALEKTLLPTIHGHQMVMKHWNGGVE